MLSVSKVTIPKKTQVTTKVNLNGISVGSVKIPVIQLSSAGGSEFAVKFTPQELTPEQQAQACENIGLGEMSPSPVQIYEDAKNGFI